MTPPRMSTAATTVARSASRTSDSFSAAAFGMSPPKPTFISGWKLDGSSSVVTRSTSWRSSSSLPPPRPDVVDMMRSAICVPSFDAK